MITIFEAIMVSIVSILGYIVVKAFYQTFIQK
jgi:hypothetical protein